MSSIYQVYTSIYLTGCDTSSTYRVYYKFSTYVFNIQQQIVYTKYKLGICKAYTKYKAGIYQE
jgi:hypothetical protein